MGWKESRECQSGDEVFTVQNMRDINEVEEPVLSLEVFHSGLLGDKEKVKTKRVLNLRERIPGGEQRKKRIRKILLTQVFSEEKKSGVLCKRMHMVSETILRKENLCGSIDKFRSPLFPKMLQNEKAERIRQKTNSSTMRKVRKAFPNQTFKDERKKISLLHEMQAKKNHDLMQNMRKAVPWFSKPELLFKDLLQKILIRNKAGSNYKDNPGKTKIRVSRRIFNRGNDGGFLPPSIQFGGGNRRDLLASKQREGQYQRKENNGIGIQILEDSLQKRNHAPSIIPDGVVRFSSHAVPSKIVKITRDSKEEYAYDIQVESEASYIAEGIIVHNSEYCEKMDGRIFRMEDLPRLIPPAHFNCRSFTVPITRFEVEGAGEKGIELSEEVPGRMAGFAQKDFLVVGEPLSIMPGELEILRPICPYSSCRSNKTERVTARFNLVEFVCKACNLPFRITNAGDLYLFDSGEEKWARATRGLSPNYFQARGGK